MTHVNMKTLNVLRGADLEDGETIVIGTLPDGIYVVVLFKCGTQQRHRRFVYEGYAMKYFDRLRGTADLAKICGTCDFFRNNECIAHNADVKPGDVYSCWQPKD